MLRVPEIKSNQKIVQWNELEHEVHLGIMVYAFRKFRGWHLSRSGHHDSVQGPTAGLAYGLKSPVQLCTYEL